MRLLPILFLCLSSGVCLLSSAQFNKGTRMIGATVGNAFFNSGTSDNTITSIGVNTGRTTSYEVGITPSMAWFLSTQTALGVSLNLGPSGQKTTYEENGTTFQKDKVNDFKVGLGVFARNYFSHSGSWLPFGQAGIKAGISSEKTEGFLYGGGSSNPYKKTYDGKSSGGSFVDFSLGFGMTKMMNENIGLDLFAGYTFSYTNRKLRTTILTDEDLDGITDLTSVNEVTTKTNNHGFMLGVGFQIFLFQKKR